MAEFLIPGIFRREVRGPAQRRAPDQERVCGGRVQDLQVQDQAQTDRRDQAVRYCWPLGYHR